MTGLTERQAPIMAFLAEAPDTATEWKELAGNVIVLCLFIIGLILAAIWWLRRG